MHPREYKCIRSLRMPAHMHSSSYNQNMKSQCKKPKSNAAPVGNHFPSIRLSNAFKRVYQQMDWSGNKTKHNIDLESPLHELSESFQKNRSKNHQCYRSKYVQYVNYVGSQPLANYNNKFNGKNN